jgi:hypothetical protein
VRLGVRLLSAGETFESSSLQAVFVKVKIFKILEVYIDPTLCATPHKYCTLVFVQCLVMASQCRMGNWSCRS